MSTAHTVRRTLLFPAVAAALLASNPSAARPGERKAEAAAASPASERSPFLGAWELDLTRMPDTYGPPPKRVVFTFDDAGSGKWRTTVEITAPDDSVRRVAAQYRRDGRAVPSEGDNIEGDSAAVHSPAPGVLVFSMAKAKSLVGARVYAVSADGREMTESAAGIDAAGTPFVRNFHFRRIR